MKSFLLFICTLAFVFYKAKTSPPAVKSYMKGNYRAIVKSAALTIVNDPGKKLVQHASETPFAFSTSSTYSGKLNNHLLTTSFQPKEIMVFTLPGRINPFKDLLNGRWIYRIMSNNILFPE